ncbi:TIGR03885 family FMN-dependent LLM class oxidoreductase [Rhodospirillaceae bacterium SYSU D60014]|uniref:TIGR03885 family FMN-dependent LLM class oxidoreductase n=1 Tax=Virgifigura deserti TaxID=2268457 RepID=UPI000E674D90
MSKIGFHASHEQFTPARLLACVRLAEQAGFQAAMSSDHFHPWSERQGQSGFAWSWLGAAMEATRLPFGVISAPGWRYHPAILAQAAATLLQMYPGRLWLSLGSGQRLNEGITGVPWPEKPERNARLRECADIIRALFRGETVTHRGRVTVVEAKLYTRPETPPVLIGAAVTAETAEWLGGWADGLITVSAKPDALRPVVDAFRRGGGEGKPLYLQVGLSWAPDEAEALRQAHEQWGSNAIGGDVNWELRTPQQFETASRHVRPEDMRDSLLVSADLGRHAGWLAEYIEIGFDELHLHNIGTNQEAFIEAFGERVLPGLVQTAAEH